MCDWWKVIRTGLIAGLVMLVVSFALMPLWTALFPSIAEEYANIVVFRPWGDTLMNLFVLQPFIAGITLAYVFEKVGGVFKQKKYLDRGLAFGFMIWVVSGIPGMFATYTSFQLSEAMVFSWLAGGLVQLLFGGVVIAWAWSRKK
ncbi:MAG: hypothetical protein V1787_04480 [Candidatus Micrarchaeota archaeon]